MIKNTIFYESRVRYKEVENGARRVIESGQRGLNRIARVIDCINEDTETEPVCQMIEGELQDDGTTRGAWCRKIIVKID